MKIITKRIKVIVMTQEELTAFRENLDKAEQGHTSHYAESKLTDGSFLGVHVQTREEEMNDHDSHPTVNGAPLQHKVKQTW